MSDKNYSFTLYGALGNAGYTVKENYLKKTNFKVLADIFKSRTEDDDLWRCEFWGKILRGGILLNHFQKDPELERIIGETIEDLLASQTPDGCISSYPADKQMQGWNLWGIKYVLLGLMRYAECGKKVPEITKACASLLAYTEEMLEKAGVFFPQCGMHGGFASSSILGAIVKVWRFTKDKRWKSLAEKLILSGCSTVCNIFEEVEKGTLPCKIGNGKSYELTSCFQGTAEYILTAEELGEEYLQDKDYRNICLKYFSMVLEREVMIAGTAGLRDSSGEYWDDGAFHQLAADKGGLGETCVTTTLLHYIDKIISLAGERHYQAAELAEKIFYNALLGAMKPDGTNFTHANPTPLTGGGWKKPAGDQLDICARKPFYGHDCCRSQGPEGLAMAYLLALRLLEEKKDGEKKNTGAVINLYEKMEAVLPAAKIVIDGEYPYGNQVKIRVKSNENFLLYLRIPFYTEKVIFNGENVEFVKGSYLKLEKVWDEKDHIEMVFDLSLKEVSAPADPSHTALMRGAIVLAEEKGRKEAENAKIHEQWNGHLLMEYSYAGNEFTPENTLQVWFKK